MDGRAEAHWLPPGRYRIRAHEVELGSRRVSVDLGTGLFDLIVLRLRR